MPTQAQVKYWESLKGRKLSEETKSRISKNNARHFLGKHLSEEHRQKLRKKRSPMSVEDREEKSVMMKKYNQEHPRTKEHCLNISKSKMGDKHPFWKGGITPENHRVRKSLEYRDWRTEVLKRDNYTCQECGDRGYKLQVDHIKPFAYYPELRLVIENGRTLCISCHQKTDTYGGKIQTRDAYETLFKNVIITK